MLQCGFLPAISYLIFLKEQNTVDLISLYLSPVKAGPSPSSFVLFENPAYPVFFSMLGQERAKHWQLVSSPHPHYSSGFGDQCPHDVHYMALKLHIKVCFGRVANVR